jgi:3D (Asp-Asp-Asp) domain-containing protein
MTRPMRHAAILLLLAATIGLATPTPASADGYCRTVRTTGYIRTEFSPWTYDGTSIYTDEPIVAASWDIPIGAHVFIPGLGRFRVADRGMLGSNGWIDVAVWDRQSAYALTGSRWACIIGPDDPDPLEADG